MALPVLHPRMGTVAFGRMLGQDQVVISRPSATSDAEGQTETTLAVITTTTGLWGPVGQEDAAWADAAGTKVHAVLALPEGTNVQEDDMVDVRGVRYHAVAVMDRRVFVRVMLRRTGSE